MITTLRLVLIIVALTFVSGCKRITRSAHVGQSRAHGTPIADGQVVLVRQGLYRGAFILTNQTTTPETTDYKWFSRSDGAGTFNITEPAVTSSIVKDASKVEFSVYSIEWSANNPGVGWIYYSLFPADKKLKPAYEICVTDETNIAGIDANDPKWVFRGRPLGKPHTAP
ncbi:MAG: hypothetical protein H7A51_13405 [Akkermansiaceae bacterium]|nr:hypothetical protein [Akkermansiaceae bacterium]